MRGASHLRHSSMRMLGVLLAVCGLAAGDHPRAVPTARQQEAFDYLLRSKHFDMPEIGIFANPSHGYVAMQIVQQSPAADAMYKRLLRSPSTAAQLYGLIGVRHTDRGAYNALAPRYRRSRETIVVESGCSGFAVTVAEMLPGIDGGKISRRYAESDPEPAVRDAIRTYSFHK